MNNQNEIIEEVVRLVDEDTSVTLPVSGQSMLPFIIGGKDSLILRKPTKVRKGDIVLAWVDGRRYVIHRIIRIDDGLITLMGDGNIKGIEHCTFNDIKAIAIYVVDRDGKMNYLYDSKRKWEAKLWYWLRPIRRYLLAIYRKI